VYVQRGSVWKAARNLEFEKAATLRDRMEDIIALMTMSGTKPAKKPKRRRSRRR